MRSDVLVLLFLLAVAGCTPARREETSVSNATVPNAPCGGCHAKAEAGWRESMHRSSFTSEDFQAAYRDEPLAFCVDCHAPHGTTTGSGVGCTSCHRDTGEHERTNGRTKIQAKKASDACKSCHEFTSPGSRTFLQSTFTEHDASPQSGVGCVDCHMKDADHRFAVSRDPTFLGRAIAIDGLRRTREGVIVSIAKRNVGHRFPTGDIFRNLFVRAWVEGADGRIVGVAETSLHRDWDVHRAAFGERSPSKEENDTRLGEAPTEMLVVLPATLDVSERSERGVTSAEPGRVRIQVDYQRGAAARAGALALFGSLRIADWTRPLPPQRE